MSMMIMPRRSDFNLLCVGVGVPVCVCVCIVFSVFALFNWKLNKWPKAGNRQQQQQQRSQRALREVEAYYIFLMVLRDLPSGT